MEGRAAAKSGPVPAHFEIFQYPAGPHTVEPAWEVWLAEPETAGPAPAADVQPGQTENEARQREECDKRIAEETRKSIGAALERGRQEGRQAERDAQTATNAVAEQNRKRQWAELVEVFSRERDRFLRDVEQEVVKLALAVAARILRREAQMDPLLLTGAVRVALGQLAATTEVNLVVPLADLDLWREAIALIPNLASRPLVSAGEEMKLGECVVETKLGTVDLGVRSQLGEIERGFFDRTAASHAPPAAEKTELLDRATEASP